VPQTNTDTRTYRNDLGPDTRPYRNVLDTDAWLSQHGVSAGPRPGQGRHRPPARHRKPPSRRMRRAATATAIVLAGGGAAVGLLYATGPQPALNGAADQNAHAVTSASRADKPEGAATTLATPAAVGQPAQAYVPRHAASGGKHAAMIEKTVTATGPTTPAAAISAPSPSRASSSASSSSSPSLPSPSSPSASSPGASPSASPAQPSAAPSASAPASTPASPPPASAGSGACTDPSFTTSSAFGSETLGAYTVSNNMWNAGGGGVSQTLSVCSSSDWSVDANVADNGGGVKTYPNSAYNFAAGPEISSLGSVTSTFGSTLPASGDFEDAYDIWLNGTAGTGGDEVMIWTDNHGQTPAGAAVTTATFDGQSYTVWQADGGPITFVSDTNITGGDLNLLQFFQWLISNGYEPADSTLNQVAYGAEIVSTNGAPETFGFSNFSVSSS
jgi:Glycosyl hydrolase family 12